MRYCALILTWNGYFHVSPALSISFFFLCVSFSVDLCLPASFEGQNYFSSICELLHSLLFLVQLFARMGYSMICLKMPVIICLHFWLSQWGKWLKYCRFFCASCRALSRWRIIFSKNIISWIPVSNKGLKLSDLQSFFHLLIFMILCYCTRVQFYKQKNKFAFGC